MKKILGIVVLCLTLLFNFSVYAKTVTIVSWGGAYTESQKLGMGKYAESKTGIKIKWVDYSGGLSEISKQVKKKKIKWDIMDVYAMDTEMGCKDGIFQKFDFDKDFLPAVDGTPASEDFFTSMPSKCAVGNILYSWNIGFNYKNLKGTPKTIQDFFDTKKFPGKRGLYKGAMHNLEIASVALGIKPNKGGSDNYDFLKNKKNIVNAINLINDLCADPNGGCEFWSAGAKPGEWLNSGKVVMSTAWNGRLFNEMIKNNPIKQLWDAQIIDYEYFALVKKSPRKKEAMEVLKFLTSAEGLAESSRYIGYAPWRKSSIPIIEAGEPWFKDGKTNMIPNMPTAPSNLKNYILMNPDFWANNSHLINKLWDNMKSDITPGVYKTKKKLAESENLAGNNLTEQLKGLADLYESGSLTKEEFTKLKNKLLN